MAKLKSKNPASTIDFVMASAGSQVKKMFLDQEIVGIIWAKNVAKTVSASAREIYTLYKVSTNQE